ncbi:MAG: hypothetical protein ACON5H_12485 [Akkermansiaceae bacterium]
MDFWDLHQESQIREASSDALEAKQKATRTNSELSGLQRQVDHLTLLCQSMWEVLREHTGLDDQTLRAKIADVDTRDGRADGKIQPEVFPCPSCGQNCNSARTKCIMCGADLNGVKRHIFEA